MEKTNVKKDPLKVLYLEDSPQDTEIIRELLVDAGFDLNLDCTEKEAEFVSLLKSRSYDVILSDFSLRGFDAFGALHLSNDILPDVPFICVSGSIGEETAIELLKKGAIDYVLKDRLIRLPFAIRRAIDEAKAKQLRRHAEEALRESERRISIIYDTVGDVIFNLKVESDGSYRYISVNRCFLSTTGLQSGQVIGKRVQDVIPEPSLTLALENYAEVIRQKKVVRWEETTEYPTGRLTGEVSISPEFDDAMRCVSLVGSVHDITERKRAEEELKFRNILLSTQQEAAIDGILVVDEQGRIISYNQRFFQIWGISRDIMETRPDESAIKAVLDKLSAPEQFPEKVNYLYTHRNETSRDEIVLADGRAFDRYSAPMLGADARYYGRVWYFRDITERKRAEEQFQKDLKVKEVMLKEIHHRVRNNLNVITSLLNLQADRITTKRQALAAFEESKNRIYAMALVQANLYEVKDFSRVNLKSFIENLSQNLLQVYQTNVEIDARIEDLSLDLNAAVPCGLILNELMTNALKHAFQEKSKGLVTIVFRRKKDGAFELTVQDNGVGLPEAIDVHQSKSLGLVIVNQLVGQMDGVLKVTRGRGTRFQITFPVSGACI